MSARVSLVHFTCSVRSSIETKSLSLSHSPLAKSLIRARRTRSRLPNVCTSPWRPSHAVECQDKLLRHSDWLTPDYRKMYFTTKYNLPAMSENATMSDKTLTARKYAALLCLRLWPHRMKFPTNNLDEREQILHWGGGRGWMVRPTVWSSSAVQFARSTHVSQE